MNSHLSRPGKGNILIVDDTPANLRLLAQMLAEHGYQVRPVLDGRQALAAAQAEPPDLVLLDIRMPEMNGYEVCQRLKAGPETSDVPIIFISALDQIEDKVRAFRAGGVDYVTKPFQIEEVLARVEAHLSLRRLQKQLEAANRKMAQELALAGEVQAGFLPSELPDLPGWQLAVMLKPARQTSGDFYDLITLPEGRLGILVADVVDKGVEAALFMALSATLIRTYARRHPAQPELALRRVNRRILDDTRSNQFISVFYGVLDPATGDLTYCNAGHNPPCLFSAPAGGALRLLGKTGMILGVMEDETWQQAAVRLLPGDVLLLYTDGATDAENEQGAFFGQEKLLQVVRRNLHRSAQDIQDAIVAAIEAFAGATEQFDDIALMTVVRQLRQAG